MHNITETQQGFGTSASNALRGRHICGSPFMKCRKIPSLKLPFFQPLFLGRVPPPSGAGAVVLRRLPVGAPVHAVRAAEHHLSNTKRVSSLAHLRQSQLSQ